jgi:2-haloacid dehalogenase
MHPGRPDVVVFDVNETLSDMAPLAQRFADVGAPEHLATTWFASVLRDGFALTSAQASAPFVMVASSVLAQVLGAAGVDDLDSGVQHVMSGFSELEVHPDVPDGVRALRRAGLRLVTLTNGSVGITEGLLTRAGLREEFERLLSVEDAGAWKPAPASYAYAARTVGVAPGAMVLVAVHPWDIDGAHRAGLRTAWIDREGADYPSHLTPPDTRASGLVELAAQYA